MLFELSDRHGFVIASDECYSEIYFRDEPPLGSLEAAHALGRGDFRRLVAFTSLSKRSNVPGMRSGFVAGDAAILKQFLLYRTYHGSAMSLAVQHASIAAWNDEAHVVANRAAVPRQVRPGHAGAGAGARRGAARRRLLPLAGHSRALGRRRRRLRARPARSIQCGGAAGQPAGARGRRGQPRARAGSGWPWSPRPPNAWKPRTASSRSCATTPDTSAPRGPRAAPSIHPCLFAAMSQSPQEIIELAWENRGHHGHQQPGGARCGRADDRRPEQRPRARGRARGRRPVEGQPVDQEGGAAVVPPERQPDDACRRADLLRQGARPSSATSSEAEMPRHGRAHRAAGGGAARLASSARTSC